MTFLAFCSETRPTDALSPAAAASVCLASSLPRSKRGGVVSYLAAGNSKGTSHLIPSFDSKWRQPTPTQTPADECPPGRAQEQARCRTQACSLLYPQGIDSPRQHAVYIKRRPAAPAEPTHHRASPSPAIWNRARCCTGRYPDPKESIAPWKVGTSGSLWFSFFFYGIDSDGTPWS